MLRQTGKSRSAKGKWLLCVPVLVLLASCRQLLSTSDYQVATESSTAGEPNGAAGAGGDASVAPECTLARPAEPPTERNVPGAKELTFVIRSVDVGDGSVDDGGLTPGDFGYDVDGVCSVSRASNHCKNPKATLDGPGGRDNAVGALLQQIPTVQQFFPLTVRAMNDLVEEGGAPPQGLFRLREYGGDRNDDYVEVDWLLPAPKPADAETEAPSWTSEDEWSVLPAHFTPAAVASCGEGGAQPALEQPRTSVKAYVTNQQLVARFPDGMPVRLWVFEVPLVDVVMTADVVFDFESHSFQMRHGVISGRAPSSTLLHEIPKIQKQFGSTTPQCRSHPSYQQSRDFICGLADWSCDQSGQSNCDWHTLGIAFETAPATVGETVEPKDEPPACVGDNDPITDTCAN